MNEELKTASDMARDPASVSAITYVGIVVVAFLGGIVRVSREVNLGEKTWKQILLVTAIEFITSLFVGLTTFFLCQANELPPFWTAALVSIGAFLGGKVLVILEAIYNAKIGKGD